MTITIAQAKGYVREKFQCPSDFIEWMSEGNEFSELKKYINSGDKDIEKEIMDRLFEAYKEYCNMHSIDIQADNRRRIHFINK